MDTNTLISHYMTVPPCHRPAIFFLHLLITLAILQENFGLSFRNFNSFFISLFFLNCTSLVVSVLKLLFAYHTCHSKFHCFHTSSFRLRQDSVHLIRLAFYKNLPKLVPPQLLLIYTRWNVLNIWVAC